MYKEIFKGSVFKITDDDGHFNNCFIMLVSWVNLLKSYKYTFLFFDSVNLCGIHGGVMLFASFIDANGNMCVLAIGIYEVENQQSWIDFFSEIEKGYPEIKVMENLLN